MNEYDFLLQDRIAKIQAINKEYDLEHNAYISFSGGKDSVVVSKLIDLALPNNRIPRVFINTGIEYVDMVKYVRERQKQDDRIIILNSGVKIRPTLEKVGYPFKSKEFSLRVNQFNKGSNANFIHKYLTGWDMNNGKQSKFVCPKCLKYIFDEKWKYNYSDRCCYELKKKPAYNWSKANNKNVVITGMKNDEGGNRERLSCISHAKGQTKFHPIIVVNEEWENTFIEREREKLCKLYYPPYNFTRTGCSGCPFSLSLQKDLDTMKQLLPIDYNRCEHLWKPVYDEYRRIGYRLRKKGKYYQVKLEDIL